MYFKRNQKLFLILNIPTPKNFFLFLVKVFFAQNSILVTRSVFLAIKKLKLKMSAWDEIFYGFESGDRDQALAKGAERRQAQERAVSH